jgi:hypothetical protein
VVEGKDVVELERILGDIRGLLRVRFLTFLILGERYAGRLRSGGRVVVGVIEGPTWGSTVGVEQLRPPSELDCENIDMRED